MEDLSPNFNSFKAIVAKILYWPFFHNMSAQSTDWWLDVSIVKPTRYINESNLFYFEWHSTCFGRSFRPSPWVQDCTYSNRHMSNKYCCLLASGNEMELHHQEFKTVHTATGVCQTDTAVCLLAGTRWNTIIRSSRLYIQQQAYVKQILLSAC